MKNILFMIPTLGGGGAEKVLITLLNSLDKRKYNITLFTLFKGGSNQKDLNKNITYKYCWKKTFRGNKLLLKLFSPEYLFKKMITTEYDVAISYLQGPATRIIGGCTNSNTKLINWVHNEGKDKKSFTSSYRNQEEMIDVYNKFDKTIFVSETAQTSLKTKFPMIKTSMDVKYNSVEDELIRELAQEAVESKLFDSQNINLVSVGRFTEQKGYIRLINIIDRLVKNGYSTIHLYLLGEGELEEQYKNLIKRNNLEEYITLLGYQENPYKYVKNADLFVCSSYREGFSTAVTESLIIGKPVVTTLCSGMKELLGNDNEYGIITENTEEDLYEGIKMMLDEPNLLAHYSLKAEQRGKEFNLDSTVKEVEKLLDTI